MVGQTELLNKINSYSLENFPKTILFLGDPGCGKHTLARYVAQKFSIDLVIVNSEVTQEQLIEYSQKPLTTFYLIDLTLFTEKQQNKLLKFIEEPSRYVYTILIANSEAGILPTILNRCIKYHFAEYSVEELKQVVSLKNELIYKICKTPGQAILANDNNVDKLYETCLNIVQNIKRANFANTLKLATKINYKEEYNKHDFLEFLNMLKYVAFEEFRKTNSDTSFLIYRHTVDYMQQMVNKSIAKEPFMLNFLTRLWEVTR